MDDTRPAALKTLGDIGAGRGGGYQVDRPIAVLLQLQMDIAVGVPDVGDHGAIGGRRMFDEFAHPTETGPRRRLPSIPMERAP